MPDIPVSSVLGYLGAVALIFSVFLILTGLNILRIEQITVAPGTKTWGLGIFLALLGIAFLWLDSATAPPTPATPAPVVVVLPTATAVPTLVETPTSLPSSATLIPTAPIADEPEVDEPTEAPTAIPQDTPIPTATATPTTTPTPTDAEAPTAIPPAPVLTSTPRPEVMIEGFEGYSSDAELAEDFEINRNAGNEGWVRLAGVPHVNQGTEAMAFEFDILHSSPNDYIGFNREFPSQDWSAYSVLCAWIESDGSNRGLVIQFGESVGRFWKQASSLSQGTGDYCVSLKEQQDINLRAIGYYGVYVQGPPLGRSIIYIDSIRIKD